MRWVEHIREELPAPRSDEPESLRRNIADELADHLQCALNRERHSTRDESQAQQKVLNRFGDVRQIARRLWFDAMQEKIMSQRITMITSTITAVACLSAVALVWMLVGESREVNLAILARLKSQPAPAAELKSMDWNPVSVKLVQEKKGGQPAEGFHVTLQGNILGEPGQFTGGMVEQTTGKDGLADLGFVRPGHYTLVIGSPWKEYLTKQITVRPGSSDPVEIICPAADRKKAEVQLSVDWPEDLQGKDYWLVCDFAQKARQWNKDIWPSPFGTVSDGLRSGVPGAQWILISPDGKLFQSSLAPDVQGFTSVRVGKEGLSHLDGKPIETQDSLKWTEGEFVLLQIALAKPAPSDPFDSSNSDGEGSSHLLPGISSSYSFAPPQWAQWSTGLFGGGGMGMGDGSGFPGGGQSPVGKPAPTFEVKPGKQNRWTLTLPEKILAAARKTPGS